MTGAHYGNLTMISSQNGQNFALWIACSTRTANELISLICVLGRIVQRRTVCRSIRNLVRQLPVVSVCQSHYSGAKI